MARQRDYKEEYRKRKQRAITEGYAGYGQKRYRLERERKRLADEQSNLDALRAKFPGLEEAHEMELPPDRKRAVDWLVENGTLSPDELASLKANPDDFWRIARPLLDRESP